MADSVGPRGIDRLLELQELDLSIDRLRSRQEELESGEDVRTARLNMEKAENVLGELKLALDSLDREQRRLENEIDSLTRKADAEQKRMYDGSVVNPKELESIQHEVQNLGQRRGRLEDELLEQLERREDLESRIKQAEAEATEARDRLSEVSGESIHELEDISKGLMSRTAERAQLAPAFDEELLELYEDLRRQKRGVGAAALEDGVCQGCHQKLSSMEMARLKKTHGVKRCEYCRRILVSPPPAQAPPATGAGE
ncbi:MAG: zinc ribbon domain-containing protein [Actinomycetota bacterium]